MFLPVYFARLVPREEPERHRFPLAFRGDDSPFLWSTAHVHNLCQPSWQVPV